MVPQVGLGGLLRWSIRITSSAHISECRFSPHASTYHSAHFPRQAHDNYIDAAWRHCQLHPAGVPVSKLILAVLGLLRALRLEAEKSEWEAIAVSSRRHFAVLRQALARAMPGLATVFEPAS